jgi:hypothetical protein
MTCECGQAQKILVNLPDAITVQLGSLNNVWLVNIAVQIYFKNIFLFSVWVPNSEENEIKSKETVPESADEDRGFSLL